MSSFGHITTLTKRFGYDETCDDELPLQLHEDTLLGFAGCDVVLVISLLDVAVGFIEHDTLIVFDSLQLPLLDPLLTLFAVLFRELGDENSRF